MEQLIKFILLGSGEFESPSSGIGSEVRDGHYDLIGPHGEIILPQVWDTVIEPGLTISMHLWSPAGDTEEDTRKAREDGARSIATKRKVSPFHLASIPSSNRVCPRILIENRGRCSDRKKC